jgi:cell division protease FtsH
MDKKSAPPTPENKATVELTQLLTTWSLILIAIFAVTSFLHKNEPICYSEFLHHVKSGEVVQVTVKGNEITGTYKDAKTGKSYEFSTYRVDDDLARALETGNIKFSGEPTGDAWSALLSMLFPIVIVVGVIMMLSRAAGDSSAGSLGGTASFGKSTARIYMQKDIQISFTDVAGVDEAKAELREVVEFLKDPQRFTVLGARLPKGILLVGPPGTGKTLLARAVAGEAQVPFFSISGSEFVELFVGVGAARVRDLFQQAKQKAPCIIFIDELDALGRARGIQPGSGAFDEKEQTLNQLLAEVDGFNPMEGVVLLAATNRPEILDAALLRAGRFDRQILVDRPDKSGREQILRVHVRAIKLDPECDIEKIASATPGFTGADLANLSNEAALLATREGAASVSFAHFLLAIERIVAGLEKKNRLLNVHERTVVAHHEMGHALVSLSLPGTDPIQKVSIIPRGIGALGYTLQTPTEDRFLMGRGELENKMAVLLGGRAAEQLVFGEISTGAADDLAKATEIARAMVLRFGMDEKLGPVTYETVPMFLPGSRTEFQTHQKSEQTAAEADAAVRELIRTALQRATTILAEQLPQLRLCANELLARETLSMPDLRDLLSGPRAKKSSLAIPADVAHTEEEDRISHRDDVSRPLHI